MCKDIPCKCGALARVWVVALLSFVPALASAEGIEVLTGRYIYDDFSMTIANGTALDLEGMGYRDAEVSIFPEGLLVSRVTAPNGERTVFKGRVTDVHLDGNQGSWVEHWPELGFSLRREIERTDDGFAFSARVENHGDFLLQGATERGVLRRVGDVNHDDRDVQATVFPETLPWIPLPEDVAKGLAEQVAAQIRIEPVKPPPGERETQLFFTEPDLSALGCTVPDGLGRYIDFSAPMTPDAQGFTLTSGTGCQVDLVNLIQKNDGSAGLWAGLRAGATGDARRRGYETELREGRVGERSEVRIFTENGAYRGFWYGVESANVLYVLFIYSELVRISPELETLLRAKIALAAD